MCDILWVVPPPSNSGNEGVGWDSLIKCNNPGGDSYWEGGQPKISLISKYKSLCVMFLTNA